MPVETKPHRVAARVGLVMGLLLMPQMALLLVLGYWSLTWLQGRPPFPPLVLPLLLAPVPLGSCLASWMRLRNQAIEIAGPPEKVLALPRLRPLVAVLMALVPSFLPLPDGT